MLRHNIPTTVADYLYPIYIFLRHANVCNVYFKMRSLFHTLIIVQMAINFLAFRKLCYHRCLPFIFRYLYSKWQSNNKQQQQQQRKESNELELFYFPLSWIIYTDDAFECNFLYYNIFSAICSVNVYLWIELDFWLCFHYVRL